MTMIPITVEKRVRKQVGKPAIPLSLGTAETQMERRTAGIVADGITSVGDELVQYAQKHKDQDIATDQAAFALHYKKVMTDAKSAAETTSDPDQVHQIYQRADEMVSDYVTGRNPDGTPNIRWKDHQDHVKTNLQGIKAQSYEMAQRRVLDIYKRDNVMKHQNLANEYIATENVKGLRSMAPLMRDSGLYTPEEVKSFISQGEAAIAEVGPERDLQMITGNLTELLGEMESGAVTPGQVLDAVDGLQIPENMGATRTKTAQKVINEAQKTASVELLANLSEYDIENADSIPFLPAKDAALAKAAEKRLAETNPGKAKLFTQSAYWSYVEKIRNYSESKDSDGSELRGLMRESFLFGIYGDKARDRLLNKVRGVPASPLGQDQKEHIYDTIYGELARAVDRTGSEDTSRLNPAYGRNVGTKSDPQMVSQVGLELLGVADRLMSDLTYSEAWDMLKTHPAFTELKRTNDMNDYIIKLDKFDRPGQTWFGDRYMERPY